VEICKSGVWFWEADSELFRMLVGRISWESVFNSKGVQEGWIFLKKKTLKVQKQAAPQCCKMSQRRRPARQNRELVLRLEE